jgi:RHS repeat-associated protein
MSTPFDKKPDKNSDFSTHKKSEKSSGTGMSQGVQSNSKTDSSSGAKQQLVSLPKGGGAIRGMGEKFDVNPVTGTGSFTVPIAISPGRGGFTPQLALSYDSGGGNSPFGLGWNVGIPQITRKTDKGLPQYLDSPSGGAEGGNEDVFILSGAEDLVHILKDDNGTLVWDSRTEGGYIVYPYRPRTEGLFAVIERWHNTTDNSKSHWRSISKESITSIYGYTENARIADPEDARKIFSWLIEKSWDAKGNLIEFEYKSENEKAESPDDLPSEVYDRNRLSSENCFANKYLKQVRYGNSAMYTPAYPDIPDYSHDWYFYLVFDYGDHDLNNPGIAYSQYWPCRLDPFSSYKAGFDIRTYRLCRRILMFHYFPGAFPETGTDPILVRSTDLEYEENKFLTTLKSVQHSSYDGSNKASLPALEFTYSEAKMSNTLYDVDPSMMQNIPSGVDGNNFQWADLYSEGISGILNQNDHAWYFIPNHGDKHYYETPVAGTDPEPDLWLGKAGVELKKPAALRNKRSSYHLGDVDSDGLPELVIDAPGMKGYYTRDEKGEWQPFKTFPKYPNINMGDPLVKMIDLTGDGLADILIGKGDYFELYLSEGINGYHNFRRIVCKTNEEEGPRAVFSDELRRIYLADISGDGLTDIVRITNGSVCYWPNLGYGRFGQKVEMKNAPHFDSRDQFNPSQLRLIDIDGTGITDILYLSSKGARYWLNQAGNAWSAPADIPFFPIADKSSTVEAVDLLGNGTSCLVWCSTLPGKSHRMRYMELTGGIKPYLLTEINNNMGGITRLQYAPSTKFYLRDKLAGKPWITRLPFPVHCLERVEIRDEVAGNIFVNLYAYHHGYYDHAEREFRGFGMVEQWDTETYSAMQGAGYDAIGANIDEHSHVPPVYTKTWFHTGFYKNRNKISSLYAEEYFSADTDAWLLPDTILPDGLSAIESREACRALRGSALRKEVYAQDGSAEENIPYTVEEKSYSVKMLQTKSCNKHAVFHVTESETIAYQYERIADDPRVLHALVLETDEYGNITKSAQVAYPRRSVPQDMPEQGNMHIVYTENNFSKITETPGIWLLGINYETKSYEVTGHIPVNDKVEIASLLDNILNHSAFIDFLDEPSTGVELRKIQHDKILFWDDDISDPLSLGQVSPQGLPYQKQSLEFTADVIAKFNEDGTKITTNILSGEGKYLQDGNDWWIISEVQTFDDSAFYLPVSIEDPFGNITQIGYDDYNLLIETTTDALEYVTTAENDYRMLQARKITDPNGNSNAVQFDTLGMVCAMAMMGANGEGDTLEAPTVIYEYDLYNWRDNSKPVYSHVKSREIHADPNCRWLEMYAYTSGLGQELQTKVQAEDGLAWQMQNGSPVLVNSTYRWTATGRTILNNKGKAVKQYEPWFSTTHDYEPETELTQYGVTPIMHYDPLGRNIKTDLPDGTFTKIEFTPWLQKQFDQNDTSSDSQWYIDSGEPDPQGSEPSNSLERAAWLSAQHYNTPQTQYFDTLGRVFLIEDDNGAEQYRVRNKLDITGRILMVTDALDRDITTNIFALTQQIITQNIDSGKRWMISDTAGKPLRAWDSRGHAFYNTYDELQRPLEMYVTIDSSTILTEKYQYGTNDNGNDPSLYNIGRMEKLWDQSGLTHITEYDFKGNPLESVKQYCTICDSDIDWSQNPAPSLQTETFAQQTEYDALNRPILITQPDGSIIRYSYNKAALLETVEVQHTGTGNYEEYVSDIKYNEKGQRIDIYYGNGSKTRYYYDDKTFRLTRLLTTRNTGQDTLQDLNYIYDAVGNIVEINDDAQQTFYYSNTVIEPRGKYWYDPLYRLIKATGRELTSLAMPTHEDFANNFPVPNTDTGAMQNYTQHYIYDALGNIQELDHYTSGQNPNWSREYVYDTATNQLLKHDQQQTLDDYTYDEHGNMLTMPHLQSLSWNFNDQLSRVELNTQGDTAYYIYDNTGNRVRKVIEKGSIREERYYLGGYEVYRKFISGDLDFERQTLHVDDDKKKISIIETKTIEDGDEVTTPAPTIRYQYDNHLGTACLELDEDAEIISYEEYHPFGTTSYRSGRTETEVSLKRYKYVGKERDEESGLYYYGARYYTAWLCRFISVDPLQYKYPHYTPFQYAGNKPISYIDLDGLEELIIVKWAENSQLKGLLLYKVKKEEYIQKAKEYYEKDRKGQTDPESNPLSYKNNKQYKAAIEQYKANMADIDLREKKHIAFIESNFNKTLYVNKEGGEFEQEFVSQEKEIEEIQKDPLYYSNKNQSGIVDTPSGSDKKMLDFGIKNTLSLSFPGLSPEGVTLSKAAATSWIQGSRELQINVPQSVSPAFDLDNDVLTPSGKTALDPLLIAMTMLPDMKVKLVGHTSSEGSDEYNLNLSIRRAQACKNYLVNQGISADRIDVTGVGESEPLPNIPTTDPLNRRVDVQQIR